MTPTRSIRPMKTKTHVKAGAIQTGLVEIIKALTL